MGTHDFASWRAELLFTGAIVQDDDASVPWPEPETRFNRYVALVEAVTGSEGVETAEALIESMQAPQDYGAYQATQRALGRFTHRTYVQALLTQLPSLIQRQAEWAGELLCGIANARGSQYEPVISEFRYQLAALSPADSATIRHFIAEQETGGWLRHRVGVLSK